MKAVTLSYHDAVMGNHDESGFPGKAASIYKLDVADMRRHFEAIAASGKEKPSSILDSIKCDTQNSIPLLLTFDDGGIGAAKYIAALLEEFGWIGHFFISTAYIDTPAFLSTGQIQELRARGHLVGSHSLSHPERMSRCTWNEMTHEWEKSLITLSDILKERVRVASVPGGYFSDEIAKAASVCGIRSLFTSEPIKRAYYVDQCLVLGRYTIKRGMPPRVSTALSSDRLTTQQIRQYFSWNLRKVAKSIAGTHYLTVRKRIISKTEDP